MGVKRRWHGFVIAVFCALGLSISAAAYAAVSVYAEGAYDATSLDVFIYADISGSPLLSQGVKLTYSETELTVVGAEKNDAVWFFGDSTTKYAYMNPETSTPGEVVFIGGKLDITDPLAGVTGNRVLLGKVSFNRATSTTPVEGPESLFDVSLALGRPAPYDNFVTTTKAVEDGTVDFVTKGVIIRERGDADGNGRINISDVSQIRRMVFGQVPSICYADCNEDGKVTISDVTCIRDKVFQ